MFLRSLTGVDLREGITGEGIDRLVWGITGKRERLADITQPIRGWQAFLDEHGQDMA